jgi:putative FmdB family regulatory protein
MPLYDYQCGKCSHKFEMRKSLKEGASACCPQCNSTAQRVLRGSYRVYRLRFLCTDYRKEKPPVETPSGSACIRMQD